MYLIIGSTPDGDFVYKSKILTLRLNTNHLEDVIRRFYASLKDYYQGDLTLFCPKSYTEIETNTERPLHESGEQMLAKFPNHKFIAELSYGTNGGYHSYFRWLVLEID